MQGKHVRRRGRTYGAGKEGVPGSRALRRRGLALALGLLALVLGVVVVAGVSRGGGADEGTQAQGTEKGSAPVSEQLASAEAAVADAGAHNDDTDWGQHDWGQELAATELAGDETNEPAAPADGPEADDADAGAASDSASDSAPQDLPSDNELPAHEDHVVLVQVDEGTTADDLKRQLAGVDAVDASGVTDEELASGLVALPVRSGSIAEAAVALEDMDGVEGAQPNYLYTLADEEPADAAALEEALSTSVNDTDASQQWGLYSIHAPEAWDVAKANKRVSVAVIDTGAEVVGGDFHEDLNDNVVAYYRTALYDKSGSMTSAGVGSYSNEQAHRREVSDGSKSRHGTNVAGIVSAEANNGIGVAGVSYNAGLVIVKATDASGGTSFSTQTLVDAYNWVMADTKNNVRVINLSVGGADASKTIHDPKWSSGGGDVALLKKIGEAYDQGILTVCAAGNKGTGDDATAQVPYDCYPGDYPLCLSVMNLQQKGWSQGLPVGAGVSLADSSNRNVHVDNLHGKKEDSVVVKDLCAPGTSIYSTGAKNGYATLTGTSQASPAVSGVAALLFAEDPRLTPQQAMNVLENTATRIEHNGVVDYEHYGYGEVNAQAAVEQLKTNKDAAVAQGDKSSQVFARIDGDTKVGFGSTQTFSMASDVYVNWVWTVSDPSIATVDYQSGVLTAHKPGTVTLTGTCEHNPDLSVSEEVTVTSPQITGPDTAEVGGTQQYRVNVGGSWSWSVSDASIATISGSGVLHGLQPGTVTIAAVNADGVRVTKSVSLCVKGGWRVTAETGKLERYWVNADGSRPSEGLYRVTDPSGRGFCWTYVRPESYVVRGRYAKGSQSGARVYFADNDGRLLDPGWHVTRSLGQGLQRYYIEPATRSAVVGYSTSGWAHYTLPAGYVLRGVHGDYYADNNGRCANGWLVTGAFGQGLQRYWMVSGHRTYNQTFDVGGGAYTRATSQGYVLRGKWDSGAGRVFVADNDGILLGSGLTRDQWVVTDKYDGHLERYWVDASDHAARSGFFEVPGYGRCFGLGGQGYVLRGKTSFLGHVLLADNDGRLEDRRGWVVTAEYDGHLERYWMEDTWGGYLGARVGRFDVGGSSYYGMPDVGYVLRGRWADMRADNDGRLY